MDQKPAIPAGSQNPKAKEVAGNSVVDFTLEPLNTGEKTEFHFLSEADDKISIQSQWAPEGIAARLALSIRTNLLKTELEEEVKKNSLRQSEILEIITLLEKKLF